MSGDADNAATDDVAVVIAVADTDGR